MTRADIVNKAKSYIKYWGNPNQFTKWYSKDNKTHAWCGMFVDYVFKKDFKCDWLDGCSNFAYVPTIVEWAKDKKYWSVNYTTAKPGDLVIYNWYPEKKNHYSHVGIVKEVKSSGIVSIEGNTTNSLGKKNCVAQKSRAKKYIAGVVRLPYVEQFNLTRLLKKGCKGADVKELQKTLGGLTADGIFGDKTLKKVKAFQKAHKLSVDGKVGKNTAHALGWLWKGK
ncbi:MAG: peptidoglycan-binding protein [Methanobrevibacter sp.]|nr:peptidoglycan-binding protein [Methanobrevibacter sp.]